MGLGRLGALRRGGRVVTPATRPREEPLAQRLLVIDPLEGRWHHSRIGDLSRWLRPGDLLVVNDAATVPASLHATRHTSEGGDRVELRLAAQVGDTSWTCVLFGAGDWRTPTELRREPPPVAVGDAVVVARDLTAVVERVDPRHRRLLTVRFEQEGAALWSALYRYGEPVQYAYLDAPLALWDVQTPFAARPWAVEMPSAGRPLAWSLVESLRKQGVMLAAITHAAGLSSTGDPALDAALPLPERFDVGAATVEAIVATRARRGRLFAAGTTVVRALEGCAALHGGELVAGEGTTDLHVDARFRPRVVDGLLTGMHQVGSSHRELLRAFAPEALLAEAWERAERAGYLDHEFGDSCLVLPGAAGRALPRVGRLGARSFRRPW
jgi:S-adenosylmethionine:tRNA ribosyltransferase-isomerase